MGEKTPESGLRCWVTEGLCDAPGQFDPKSRVKREETKNLWVQECECVNSLKDLHREKPVGVGGGKQVITT